MHLSHEKKNLLLSIILYTGWLIGILFIAHLDVLFCFCFVFFWFPTSKLSVTNHIFQLTSVIIQVALHCARVKFNWNVKGIVSLLRFSSQQHLICCGDKAIVYRYCLATFQVSFRMPCPNILLGWFFLCRLPKPGTKSIDKNM